MLNVGSSWQLSQPLAQKNEVHGSPQQRVKDFWQRSKYKVFFYTLALLSWKVSPLRGKKKICLCVRVYTHAVF